MRLENWYTSHYGEDIYVVVGEIYEDKWNRWPDGYLIHTSLVRSHKSNELKEGLVITTNNNEYELGKKLEI